MMASAPISGPTPLFPKSSRIHQGSKMRRLPFSPFAAGLSLCALMFEVPLAAATAAQPTWQTVGQIGGPIQAVAVQGHLAYVGVGPRLVVVDVTDPSSPREVGGTLTFPYFVEDVAVA